MNFTPKTKVAPGVCGILTIAAVGFSGFVSDMAPQKTFETREAAPVVRTPSVNYQPVAAWYRNKHWWKRNAPIVGGAAGGSLVGGLVGGGTGAVVGGAVGGGGGYLYKRYHHHHNHNAYRHQQNYHYRK